MNITCLFEVQTLTVSLHDFAVVLMSHRHVLSSSWLCVAEPAVPSILRGYLLGLESARLWISGFTENGRTRPNRVLKESYGRGHSGFLLHLNAQTALR